MLFSSDMLLASGAIIASTASPEVALFANGEVGSWVLPGTEYGVCYTQRITSGVGTVCVNNNPVGTYRCLITGVYWTAPSDAARPIYKVDQWGILTWMEPDAVDDYLQTDQMVITSDSVYSAAAFAPIGPSLSSERLLSLGNTSDSADTNSSGRASMIQREGTTLNWYGYRATLGGAPVSIANGAAAVIESQYIPGTHMSNLNGGTDQTIAASTGVFAVSRARLFTRNNTSLANFTRAWLYGGLVINRALTSAERASVRTVLGARRGVVL